MPDTHESKPLGRPATVVFGDNSGRAPCIIQSISREGARLSMVNGDRAPDKVYLWLTPDGSVRRPCTIVYRTLCSVGVEFD